MRRVKWRRRVVNVDVRRAEWVDPGLSQVQTRTQFVDVEKSAPNPFKKMVDSAHSVDAKSLVGLGSRAERCPTRWTLTPASAGVKSVSFLRNLVVYPRERTRPSMYSCGRIAPVVHHRRPHNIL